MTAFADHIYHGAAWYPELWLDKIDEDIRLMKQAGIDLVRVGEFAWSSMEPREGEYDFAWLREAMDKCHAAGISVVLCTPTPTPPAWLTRKYPEVLRIDADGRAFIHGSRQHVSHTSPKYRQLSRGITEKLARELGRHPAVVAWQTDNEFLCHVDGDYGPSALDAWHVWLKRKYGSIDNLNKTWRAYIWSEDYLSFDDVPMPQKTPFHHSLSNGSQGQHHCSLAKDWGHFTSDTVVAFQAEQLEIIRKHSDAPITHNHIAPDKVFWQDLFADLDFSATDIYLDYTQTWRGIRTLDWMRGSKMDAAGNTRPYMILETSPSHNGATQIGHQSHPKGFLRAEAAIHLGAGGNAFCYWLWRQQASGVEMCHGSVITSWGTPAVGFGDVQAVSEFIAKAAPLLKEVPPAPADVAVLDSRHSRAHLMRSEKLWGEYNGWTTISDQVFRPLMERGIWRDVRFEDADFSHYKAVLAPFAPVLTDALIDKLTAFVEAGGVWVVGPMSGVRTEFGTVHTDAGLGRLDELAGVRTLFNFGVPACKGTFGKDELTLGWHCFGLEKVAADAEPLGEYTDGPAAGALWAVQRRIGKGRIVLLAAHAPDNLGRVLDAVLADVPVRSCPSSWGTTVIPREGNGRRGYIIANWDGAGGTATLPEGGKDLLTGEQVQAGELKVAPFGVMAVMCR